MPRSVIWSRQAQCRFEETLDFIHLHFGQKSIITIQEELGKKLNLIEKFPGMYPLINKVDEVRAFTLGRYLHFFYQVDEASIYILTVRDQRQNPLGLEEFFK